MRRFPLSVSRRLRRSVRRYSRVAQPIPSNCGQHVPAPRVSASDSRQRAGVSLGTAGSLAMAIASAVIGGSLLVLLAGRADLDPGRLVGIVTGLRLGPVALIAFAMCCMSWCSAEKWRVVVRTACPDTALELGRGTYFACTAFGLLTGQLLPPSVGAAAARSAGVKLLGGTIVQATSATAFEQVFDAALACWCAAATLATIALHLAPAAWLLATAVACALCVLSTLLAARRLSTLLVRDNGGAGAAWQALLEPALTWRLVALSVCRYGALIVSAYAAALAGDLPVALWQVAAVMPLAVLTVLVSFVPAGLGVNEWTFASALTVLGVPFATAAEFALLNRFLNVLGAVAIAALGGAVLV